MMRGGNYHIIMIIIIIMITLLVGIASFQEIDEEGELSSHFILQRERGGGLTIATAIATATPGSESAG